MRPQSAHMHLRQEAYGGNTDEKPIVPGADELEYNPRSRSSKLRAIKKL